MVVLSIGSIGVIPISERGADDCTSLSPGTLLVLFDQQLILLKEFQCPTELKQEWFVGVERLVADIEQALESVSYRPSVSRT